MYKTTEAEADFPCEQNIHPDQVNSKKLLPYEAFHNKLRNCNPPEKDKNFELSKVDLKWPDDTVCNG